MYSGGNSYSVFIGMLVFLFILVILLIAAVIIMFVYNNSQKNDIMNIKQQINKILINNRNSESIPTYIPPSTPKPYTESIKVEVVKEKQRINYENWFGRNVVGLAAAILVFIGLIFLGILVYKYIPETGKIIAMYLISAIITGIGIFLTRKFHNTFTQILTGCGMGCFFISILLTHVYFHKIQDITAFSLLLVWLVLALIISKIMSSTLISIVAHLGMIISICFAFTMGLTDEKLIILLIYQGATIAIIIVGNIICCKQTYRFGLFVSLILTIIASTFMWNEFILNLEWPKRHLFAFNSPLSAWGIVVAFALQFLCAAFLSYLISVSTNKIKHKPCFVLVHIANKLLLLWTLMINVFHVIYRISYAKTTGSGKYEQSVFLSVSVCLIILLIHGVITLLITKKFNFSKTLENCSVIILTCFSGTLLLVFYSIQYNVIIFYPHLTWLVLISVLLFVGYFISKNITYKISAFIVLGIDVLFMISDGYDQLNYKGEVWLPMIYISVISLGIFSEWFINEISYRKKFAITYKTLALFFIEASLISLFESSSLRYWSVILLLSLSALNIILYYIRFDQKSGQGISLKILMHINEIFLIIFSIAYISSTPKSNSEIILSSILTLFVILLAFIRIKEIVTHKQNPWTYIWTGIKFTLIILAFINGITTWFDYVYIFSIVVMLTALACVCFGFFVKAKSIRLYGLILTLICVIKLVTYDVAGANTILRVSALIGGGVICFAISALYSYMEKRIKSNE